jgi:hypothetical protein
VAAAAVVVIVRVVCRGHGHPRGFLNERKQGIAFSAAGRTAGVFAQKKNDKRENEAEADGQRKRDDVHGGLSVV